MNAKCVHCRIFAKKTKWKDHFSFDFFFDYFFLQRKLHIWHAAKKNDFGKIDTIDLLARDEGFKSAMGAEFSLVFFTNLYLFIWPELKQCVGSLLKDEFMDWMR